jgi:dephospho-CoA kinase
VIGVSGAIAAGKTTLATELEGTYGAIVLCISDVLRDTLMAAGFDVPSRVQMANLGDDLAASTRGSWLVDQLRALVANSQRESLVVIDAVRRRSELAVLRDASDIALLHVYLQAPLAVRVARYKERGGSERQYLATTRHPSEAALAALEGLADVVLDSSRLSPEDEARLLVGALPGSTEDSGGD